MKENWKAGNMIYPVPAMMVSCGSMEKSNIITIAWCGTICTNPPMAYISVRPERYSYNIIKESKEFVINLVTEDLVRACDFCGVRSGKDVDKFKEMNLTKERSKNVDCPSILESPVNVECRVKKIVHLGSHDMFIADVVGVRIDNKYMEPNGRFDLNSAKLIAYSHGEYFGLGECLGKFGYSVKKNK